MPRPRSYAVFSLKKKHERAILRSIDTVGNMMVLLGNALGAIMRSDMGTFRVDVEVEKPARPEERRTVKSVLVDSGAELSWIPAEVLDSLGVFFCSDSASTEIYTLSLHDALPILSIWRIISETCCCLERLVF